MVVVTRSATRFQNQVPVLVTVDPVAVEEPMDPVAVEEPMDPVAVEEPMDPVAVEEPMDPVAVEEPMDPVAVEEPMDPVAVEEPMDPVAVEEPMDQFAISEESYTEEESETSEVEDSEMEEELEDRYANDEDEEVEDILGEILEEVLIVPPYQGFQDQGMYGERQGRGRHAAAHYYDRRNPGDRRDYRDESRSYGPPSYDDSQHHQEYQNRRMYGEVRWGRLYEILPNYWYYCQQCNLYFHSYADFCHYHNFHYPQVHPLYY